MGIYKYLELENGKIYDIDIDLRKNAHSDDPVWLEVYQ